MQTQRQAEFFTTRIHRPQRFVIDVVALNVHGHVHRAHARQPGGAIQLLHRKFRRLQRQHHRAEYAIRVGRMRGSDGIVERARQFQAEFWRRPIHHRVGERECAHVHLPCVHVAHHDVQIHHVGRERRHQRHARQLNRLVAFVVYAHGRAVGRAFGVQQRNPFGRKPVRVGVDGGHGRVPYRMDQTWGTGIVGNQPLLRSAYSSKNFLPRHSRLRGNDGVGVCPYVGLLALNLHYL